MAVTVNVLLKDTNSGSSLRQGGPVRYQLLQNGAVTGGVPETNNHTISFPGLTVGANDVLTLIVEPVAG